MLRQHIPPRRSVNTCVATLPSDASGLWTLRPIPEWSTDKYANDKCGWLERWIGDIPISCRYDKQAAQSLISSLANSETSHEKHIVIPICTIQFSLTRPNRRNRIKLESFVATSYGYSVPVRSRPMFLNQGSNIIRNLVEPLCSHHRAQ